MQNTFTFIFRRFAAFVFVVLIISSGVWGQTKEEVLLLSAELEYLFERDQKTRTHQDSAAFIHYIDSTNQRRVSEILNLYGWLGVNTIGKRANHALFFIIQHAPLETQLKYFPWLKASVEAGESQPSHMALMVDRIRMRQGEKQVYGSQVVFDKEGKQILHPIEDEKNVNLRRASMGMQPLEEYAKLFGIHYQLPDN